MTANSAAPRPEDHWIATRMARVLVCGSLAFLCASATPLRAQSLNPRAYWPAPNGTNVVSFGYAYTTGGFLADPSLPIENVDAETHGLQAGYVRFFSLAGRTARLGFTIPRADSTVEGRVEDVETTRVLSGYADSSVELSINLTGAPTMSREEFVAWVRKPSPILGLTLKIQAPTGTYDPELIVNLGTNRWSAKPEIGHISVWRGWVTEATAGIRFFGTNDDFQGQVREQNPIGSAALHFGRPIRRAAPDFWFSFGIAYAYGGRTTVDGIENNDLQQNWRTGGAIAYPFGKGNVLRLSISTSLKTSIGEDSTSGILAYAKAWG